MNPKREFRRVPSKNLMLRQDKPKARLPPLLQPVETQLLLLQLEEATNPSISSKLLRKLGKVSGALVVPEQVQQQEQLADHGASLSRPGTRQIGQWQVVCKLMSGR